MNRFKIMPDRDDLIGIFDEHDVEQALQTSLKQQLVSHGIPPTAIDRTPQPKIQDGGIDIAIEIPESYSMPEVLGLVTNNNHVILQIKHTKDFLTSTEVKKEINKEAVKEFFQKA